MDPVTVMRPRSWGGHKPLLTEQGLLKMRRNPPDWWVRPRRSFEVGRVADALRVLPGPRRVVSIWRLEWALGQRPDQDKDGEWYDE